MPQLFRKLERLSDPIRVGVIGAGTYGSQLSYQIEQVPGITLAVIANRRERKALDAFRNAGVSADAVHHVDSPSEANAVIADGDRAVLNDGVDVPETDVDVVVEATGSTEAAARHAYRAILEGKHVVNATVEADTLVGPVLNDLAENADVTYTMAYGDQPGQVIDLCDRLQTCGLDVVAAGRCMGGRQTYGTPDDIFERAHWDDSFIEKYDVSARAANAAMDGTKVAIESCVIANALGLRADTPGMHMPTCTLDDLAQTFRPEEEGGILTDTGVVDVIESNTLYSGWVVTEARNEHVREYAAQERSYVHSSDDGRYQAFYQPSHFAPDTIVSIATAALYNEATSVVRAQETDVVGVAKQDLEPGTQIAGGGGYAVYGTLENHATVVENDYVPLELLHGVEVIREIEQDRVITTDDVQLHTDSFAYTLRTLQESA